MDFPQFDGKNLKMWQHKCESYFDLYAFPVHMWVKFATHNFIAMAAFWLQSVDAMVKVASWKDLCLAVHARFERDQYNHFVRQFFHVRQVGTVAEYIEQFDEIVHQLRAHDPNFSAILTTNRFVDGVKDSIRAVVMIHKLIDLDTASSLALLQEELTVDVSKREFRRSDGNSYLKTPPTSQISLPATTQRHVSYGSPDEKKHVDSPKLSKSEDLSAAIKAYRRAKGLRYKCGVKWNPSHKWAPTCPCMLLKNCGKYYKTLIPYLLFLLIKTMIQVMIS